MIDDRIFLQLMNMSFTASVIILFVIVLRFFFKKLPKIFSYMLWLPVLFRFVCPYSVESVIHILPTNPYPIPLNIEYEQIPQIHSGIVVLDKLVNSMLPQATPYASVNPLQIYISIGQLIWELGLLLLIGFGIVNFILLRRRIKGAVSQGGNVYLVEGLKDAVIIGIIYPKIYLSAELSEEDRKYILLHQQTHIKYYDHIIMMVMKLILYINWANPIAWIAYILCRKDMEMSCDERVIQQLGNVQPDYAAALTTLARGKNTTGQLIVFAERAGQQRAENIVEYTIPARQVVQVVSTIVIVISIILMLNPIPSSRKWAKGLAQEDIASIEVITTPASEDKRYYKLEEEEFETVVALANQSRGQYVNGAESLSGGGITFYITTKDGTFHRFGNAGNTHLVIDGDSYDASYSWLSNWSTDYPYGTAPEFFLAKIKGEY